MKTKENKIPCIYCKGTGTVMKETEIQDRCYSSTSSGELNGPYEAKCDWCNGKGWRKKND